MSVDHYIAYKGKAPKSDPVGNPIDHKLPKPWAITVDDLNLPNTEADDPENFVVKNAKNLLNPARKDNQAAPSKPALHYLRYDVALSKHGAGPIDSEGNPTKPAKHIKRRWELLNQFGAINVVSKKAKGLLLPAHQDLNMSPATPPGDETHYVCYQIVPAAELTAQTPGVCPSEAPSNPRGQCTTEADCGGSPCEKPKFRRDLQAFFADTFDDCALNTEGGVGFQGQLAEGMCLFDIKKPRELCNPIHKSAVVPPRDSVAVISESTASTTDSLLCYQIGLATSFKHAPITALGGAVVGDKIQPKQAKSPARRVKDGNPVYTVPGNSFPVPTLLDTKGQALACIPTIVSSFSPVP